MAIWQFFSDAALTNAYTALSLTATGATFPIYLGSTTTGRKIVSTTTGANLTISITDSATGSGHAVTAVKLATTTGGLAAASGGAALTGPTFINGGTAGAYSFYALITDAVGDGAFSNELALVLSSAKEQAVT